MAMTARELNWQESYERVANILPMLTKRELDIIADVADEFRKTTKVEDIKPLSEQELIAMIDHAIQQADKGEVVTLEEVLASVDQEFGL